MPADRQKLALELKQIIQADRMAVDILTRAEDMKKAIERQTEKDKASMLQKVKTQHNEMVQRVEQEMAADMIKSKEEAAQQFEQQRNFLNKTMDENRQKWVDEITSRITSV